MQGSRRDTDMKNRLTDSVGEGEGKMIWENNFETYISICKIDDQGKFDAWSRVLKASALGWPRGMGWGRRWEGVQDGGHMYTMADSCQHMASSVQFSCSIMSNSLWPHELQHARPPCPSATPRVYPNSCPLSQYCHSAISSSVVPFSSCPCSLPASTLCMRWPKYWSFSFSISPSKKHLGLISFSLDWLDLLAVQGTLKSLLQHHSSKSINSLALSFLHSPTLTSIHDHWKNHSLD